MFTVKPTCKIQVYCVLTFHYEKLSHNLMPISLVQHKGIDGKGTINSVSCMYISVCPSPVLCNSSGFTIQLNGYEVL